MSIVALYTCLLPVYHGISILGSATANIEKKERYTIASAVLGQSLKA